MASTIVQEHVLVIHRWAGSQAQYNAYVDHARTHVSYICPKSAAPQVPDGHAGIELVEDIDDEIEVIAAAYHLIERLGLPTRVIALNEGDLLTAAHLREAFGLSGQSIEDLLPFRDKVLMATIAADGGCPGPPSQAVEGREDVERFCDEYCFPVVVKPRLGTASRGVFVVTRPDDLKGLPTRFPEPFMVQRHCSDPIFHIDGFWDGFTLGPWRASKYINDCAGYRKGKPLGSCEADDPKTLARLTPFVEGCCTAFSPSPMVFHLELFVSDTHIQFLEIGCRVGGAEVPFIWREVHGIDLIHEAWNIQMGIPSKPSGGPKSGLLGGWLLTTESTAAPTSPTVYWHNKLERSPKASGLGIYEGATARFRFKASTTADLEKDIRIMVDTVSRKERE